jgi:hypothetical protein
MVRRYQLCAMADPNTTVFENAVLAIKADRTGALVLITAWTVHIWLDDKTTGSQLFAVVQPDREWPNQQNCHIQNLVLQRRLRVQELQLQDNRSYVIATGDEPKEGRDD